MNNKSYKNAPSPTEWLLLKYGITYKQYRHKSKTRREALKEECMRDTGIEYFTEAERRQSREDVYELLASIGVPLNPMEFPLDIG